MDEGERGVFVPSPPSSVPAVLAVKGIAPPAAVPRGPRALSQLCLRRGLSYPLELKSRASPGGPVNPAPE
jgi:hypothetical protein